VLSRREGPQSQGHRNGFGHCERDYPRTWRGDLGEKQTGRRLGVLLFAPTRATEQRRMSAGKILVVDDDPQIRRAMRTTLTARGFEVGDARTGEEALEELRSASYDLALLDMNMPGMGGIETCRLIRSASEIAIIMLTVS